MTKNMSLKKKLDFEYKTSTDYNRLYELIQNQRIVCFIQDDKRKNVCASPLIFNESSINIGVPGISYISAFDFKEMTMKEDFIQQCKSCNLEFLDPEI